MHLKSGLKSKKIAAFGQSTAKYTTKNGFKVDFHWKRFSSKCCSSVFINSDSKEIIFIQTNKSLGTVQSVIDNRNKIIVETCRLSPIDKKVENHDYLVFTKPE